MCDNVWLHFIKVSDTVRVRKDDTHTSEIFYDSSYAYLLLKESAPSVHLVCAAQDLTLDLTGT